MALGIVLDLPRPAAFSLEDIVKGRVILQSQKDEAVGHILIAFVGRTKTKLYRRQHIDNRSYKSEVNLFNVSRELYQGHYTLRANTYEWPFEFHFPSQTDPLAVSNSFAASPPLRSSSEMHPLPRSYSHNNSGLDRSFECQVEYKLEATLARNGRLASSLESVLPLKYMSYCSSELPTLDWKYTSQIFTAHSLRLLPEKADAKLSMKEKMTSTFKSSGLPSVTFSLKMRYPTQIYPEDQPSIHLSVQYLSFNCPEKPIIFLKSVNLKTKTDVRVRAPGLTTEHFDVSSQRHQLLLQDGLNINLPESSGSPEGNSSEDIEGWLDLNGNSVMTTQSLQPDFSTYNIALSNELDAEIKVTCADKLFKFSKTLSLVVLPWAFAAPSATSGEAVEIGESAVPVPPPSYEHVPEYEETPEETTSTEILQNG